MVILAAGGVIWLPWEEFGAPLLAILAAGGIAFLLLRFDTPGEERPFVLRLVLSAIAVHSLAAAVYRLLLHGPLMDDAIGYDKVGAVLAGLNGPNPQPGDALGSLSWLTPYLFPRMVGQLYGLLGRSPGAVVALNILFGACAVCLIYRLAALLLGPVTARWAGWLAVFYSGFWLFSVMGLKDALGIFLLLLFLRLLYGLWDRMLRPGSGGGKALQILLLAAALAAVSGVAGEIREYVTPILVVTTASFLLVWSGRYQRRWVTVAICAAAVAAGILLWSRIAAYPLVRVSLSAESGLGQVVEVPPTESVGQLAGWILQNPAAFGKYILLSTLSTLLAPYAWSIPLGLAGGPPFSPYTVAMPGMWLWYACLPFCVMGLFSAWKRSKGDIFPLLVFTVCLYLLFSLIIPRESRHRDILMPVLLILSAEGWVYCRRFWALGFLFWVPLSLFAAWHLHALGVYAAAMTVAAAVLVAWFFLIRMRPAGGRT
jgi:hypothetical protein